jgi:soluble lytic murein transglycosylase
MAVNKFKAWQQGGLVTALVGTCFALGSVAPGDGDPTAPPSVFALPEVTLPRNSPESRAVAALAAGRTDEARRIVTAAITHAKEPSLGRLRWLLAKSTPDIAEARVPLQALATSGHALSNWARLRLAERLRDRDPNAAAEAAETLLIEPLFRARAEQLLALSLYAANRRVEAEPLLRSLVAETPERSAAVSFSMPLANILAAKPDLPSQKQALALYRRVLTRAPTSSQAPEARIGAQQVLGNMPSAQRIALQEFTADEAFAEAEALSHAHEYSTAASRYAAIAQRFKGDPKSACDARLGQASALYAGNKRDQALSIFDDVARVCQNPDHRANANYQAGRALLRRGDPQGAIAHYDAVAKYAPGHKLADDALVAAASAFRDLGDLDGARSRLRQALQLGPLHDQRGEAHFALAWIERSLKHYDLAINELEQLIAEDGDEKAEGSAGRAPYWRARTLLDAGKLDQGEKALIELVQSRPFSYYGQQALSRLEELDSAVATRQVTLLHDDAQPERVAVKLAARPELQRVEFKRAIELLRVGEVSPAVDELEGLGCLKSSADDDLYMLGVSLIEEFGADGEATPIARRRVSKIMAQPPKGQALAFWRVVFPRAYRPLIDDVARKVDIPASFVRAIAREESSFDADAVSRANAYGLIQLIRPTARKYAKPLGLPSDPDSLKTPEINLRIGTAFMRYLFDRYRQNFALVPSAYNAGPGATDRWLRERGQLPLDEWIETIPYKETRRYTKRVLQSYGVYAWLDEGRVPPLVQRLNGPSNPAL